MKKRLMMILSVMLIALTCAFAAQEMTVTWEWRIDDDPDVNYYRWQINGTDPDGWRIESGDTGEITVKELDPYQSYTLYLQRSYDGVNWSETASAEAAALLVEEAPVEEAAEAVTPAETAVPEAPEAVEAVNDEAVEAPVEEAAVEEAPAEEAVVEEAPAAEEAVVEEAPAAEEKKPSRFEFSLLMRPGAQLAFDFGAASKISGSQTALTPFAIGLDFANIVSNDSVGFGLRLNLDADAYINDGWGSLLGSPAWNPLKWQWGKMVALKDSYTWAIDPALLAMFNARAGIADFNIGLGAGASVLLDIYNGSMETQLPKYAKFANVFNSPIDIAPYADFQLGARFYLGKVVALGIEADYKMYIPNFKLGDLGVNAVLGFTF